MSRELSMPEIIRRAIDGRLLDVRTSIPGEIVSYNASARTATVRPGVRIQAVDSDSAPEVDTIPDLENVPVLFPSCAAFEIVFPLAAGDPVRIEFSEEDDSLFYETTDAVPVNPEILRRHGASVVCRPEGHRGTPGSKATFIGSDGSNVLLGADDAADYLAITDQVLQAVSDAVSAAPVTPADGGAALKAGIVSALATAIAAAASYSATKVRAK